MLIRKLPPKRRGMLVVALVLLGISCLGFIALYMPTINVVVVLPQEPAQNQPRKSAVLPGAVDVPAVGLERAYLLWGYQRGGEVVGLSKWDGRRLEFAPDDKMVFLICSEFTHSSVSSRMEVESDPANALLFRHDVPRGAIVPLPRRIGDCQLVVTLWQGEKRRVIKVPITIRRPAQPATTASSTGTVKGAPPGAPASCHI